MIGPPIWLRRAVGRLERRWIPDLAARHAHTKLVVSRLPDPEAVPARERVAFDER